jgi:predicted DNA-binding transcriptional regulator YafY
MARYEQTEQVLRLVLELQASASGLCMDEITDRFEISRRTAERRLKAARELFPEIEVIDLDDGRKHWRLAAPRAQGLVRLDAAEVAALETAIELLRRGGLEDQVQALRALAPKIKVLADARRPGP